MSKFFTNIQCLGNTILHRYVEDGIRKQEKITDFKPVIFTQNTSGIDSGFKDLYGQPVTPKYFDNITSARNYIKDYGSLEGAKLYGITKWDLQFASNEYPDDIEYESDKIRKFFLDIECVLPERFSKVMEAEAPIQVMTVYDSITKKYYMFGESQYVPEREDVLYMFEPDERQRLIKFVTFWEKMSPDVVSGWNSVTFDMVYLYTRIIKVLGEDFAKRLSPWGRCRYINVDSQTKEVEVEITGVSQIDYLELYKKYNQGGKESYKLDDIAELELGTNKTDYTEYGSLYNLYDQNFPKFALYNQVDVNLVVDIDNKFKYLDIQIQMAYTGKINYRDVFSPLKLWTGIIYDETIKSHIVMPMQNGYGEDEEKKGAFVFPPKTGMRDWIVSFDFTSLYPTTMASFNISPETKIRNPVDVPPMLLEIWGKDISNDMFAYGAIPEEITQCLKDNNLILAGNGQLYRSDIEGIFSKLIRKLFALRKAAKSEMLKLQEEYERDKSKVELKKRAEALSAKEQAIKLALNILYGCLGNLYFSLFDIDNVEAVTLSGQGFIKYCTREISAYLSKVVGVNDDYIIGGDTDSCYVEFGPLVKKYFSNFDNDEDLLNKLVEVIDTKFATEVANYVKTLNVKVNTRQSMMGLKREKVISRACFMAKKTYFGYALDSEGVRYAEPKFFDVGVASKRSSTPKWARESLRDCYKIILKKTPDDLYEYVDKLRVSFDTWDTAKISIPRGVTDIDKYLDSTGEFIKGTPQNVKAAAIHNRHVKRLGLDNKYRLISNGEKMRFVYLDKRNPFRSDVCGFGQDGLPVEFDIEKYIDRDRHFEAFFSQLELACKGANWSPVKTVNIEDFF